MGSCVGLEGRPSGIGHLFECRPPHPERRFRKQKEPSRFSASRVEFANTRDQDRKEGGSLRVLGESRLSKDITGGESDRECDHGHQKNRPGTGDGGRGKSAPPVPRLRSTVTTFILHRSSQLSHLIIDARLSRSRFTAPASTALVYRCYFLPPARIVPPPVRWGSYVHIHPPTPPESELLTLRSDSASARRPTREWRWRFGSQRPDRR